jgi:hypothetical protein
MERVKSILVTLISVVLGALAVSFVSGLLRGPTDSMPADLVNVVKSAPHAQQQVFRSYIRMLSDSLPELPGMREEQLGKDLESQFAYGMARTSRGSIFLDDEILHAQAGLISQMLARTGEAECAAHVNGTLGREAMFRIVLALDEASLRRYLAATWTATKLGHVQRELPSNTDSDYEWLFERLASELPESQQERLFDWLDHIGESDREDCWANRTIFRLAHEMPIADGARVMRVMLIAAQEP